MVLEKRRMDVFNSLAYRNGDNVGNNMIAFLLKRKYFVLILLFKKVKAAYVLLKNGNAV